jgi:hypothetical protein
MKGKVEYYDTVQHMEYYPPLSQLSVDIKQKDTGYHFYCVLQMPHLTSLPFNNFHMLEFQPSINKVGTSVM